MVAARTHIYSLRQVVELTGVSEFTLRGWEARYQALKPRRTGSGRRLYSRSDILRARALLDLTLRGHRIGLISRLSPARLQELVALPESGAEGLPAVEHGEVADLMGKMRDFRWHESSQLIQRERKRRSARDFIFGFLLPLLELLKVEVENKRFSVAQEHILSSFLKENLYALRMLSKARSRAGIRLVLATPEGDFHEIGLLIASTLASLAGIEALYLGANMPKEDLCQTCLRFQATHLLLASTTSQAEGAREDIYRLTHFLDRQLPPETALWLAGPLAEQMAISLKRPSRKFGDFADFEEVLSRVGKAL